MGHRHQEGVFIDTAIATLANGVTADEGSEFDSNAVDVSGASFLAVQLEATGADAAIIGDVTAYFAGSPKDAAEYDTFNDTTQAMASLVLKMTTNSTERHSDLIDVRGLASIKLIAITNGADYGITLVNVNYGFSEEVA